MPYTSRQLDRVVPRSQLKVWISRGIFEPLHPAGAGKERLYEFEEAMRLAAISSLAELGLDLKQAGIATRNLHGWKHDTSYLVISVEPAYLIPFSRRGDPAYSHDELRALGHKAPYPVVNSRIVRGSDLQSVIGESHVYASAVLNLDNLESRVRTMLGEEADEEKLSKE